MINISNFLKSVFLDMKKESKNNISFFFLLLVLITIPLPNIFNTIALVLLIVSLIANYQKTNYQNNSLLLLPLTMFILMGISYFWSIDKQETLRAILKETALLLIPLVFMFIKFTLNQKKKIITIYSYSMVVFTFYFLIRALIRYIITNETRVFFYHGENNFDYGLVPKLLNAIHVSVYAAIAFFYFFNKEIKSITDNIFSTILFGFILLLSSKSIILVVVILIFIQLFYFSKIANKMRLKNLIVFGVIIGLLFSFGKIKQYFSVEFQSNTTKSLSPNVINGLPKEGHNVSIYEAWNNEKFLPTDFFSGTAFRVYQIRVFSEIISENNAYLTGFGLNASTEKVAEKAKKYNLFLGDESNEGYHEKNFHNQYIQNFSDLGIIGFALLLIIMLFNIKNAIKNKDFLHFSFAVLMISLFLTESFLWRQRGVVFFTLFYCLFNTNVLKDNPKN